MKVNSKDWTLEISDSDRDKTMSGHVGENIRAFRKKAGLTQAELADMLSHPDKRLTISRTALAGYEQGQAFPPLEKLERIAAALKVAPMDILISEGAAEEFRSMEISKRIQDDLFAWFGYSVEQDHSETLRLVLEADNDEGVGIDAERIFNGIPYKIVGNGKEAHIKDKDLKELMKQIRDYSQFLINKLIEEHS